MSKIIVYDLDVHLQYPNKEKRCIAHFTTLKEIHTFLGDLIEHEINVVEMKIIRLDKKYNQKEENNGE